MAIIPSNTFLGDSAFDSVGLYKQLLTGTTFSFDNPGKERHFLKVCIPLNQRSHLVNAVAKINALIPSVEE